MPERSSKEILHDLMGALTALANPKYVHEGLGPELWIRLNSIRMDLSPNTIHESFSIEPPPEVEP